MATSKTYYTGQGPVNTVSTARDITNNVVYNQSEPKELDQIYWNIQSPEVNFVGRSLMLRFMENAMKTSSVKSNIIVIVGLGGVGKTQLVRKFIQDNRSSYINIIWINSEKNESINESFKRLASNELKISVFGADGQVKETNTIIEQVLNKLCKSKTLCVYDNVDKIESIKFALTIEPSGGKPHVIITSRIREWDDGIEVKQLNVWEYNEAFTYVSTTLKNHADEVNDKNLLVEKLQNFPLALRQATAYINYQRKQRTFSIADYLHEYETKDILDSVIFKEAITNIYEKTTFTTWRITIDAIKKYGATGALACRILNIIAYFDPDNIHRDVFTHLTDHLCKKSIWCCYRNKDRSKRDFEGHIMSAVRLLNYYSMVDGQEALSVLSIHRLVQLVIKLDLAETRKDKAVLKDALVLISKLIKVEHVKLNVSHSHLISVYLSALNFDDLVKGVDKLPIKILFTLFRLGKYNQAISFGKDILQPLERILGENHPNTFDIRDGIANAYTSLGKHTDAIRMYEDILEKRKIILRVNHPDLFLYRQNIVLSLVELGKYTEAIQMCEEILEKCKINLGAHHLGTLSTMHNLAYSYGKVGKHIDAIQMSKKCLEEGKKSIGEDHDLMLTTRHNMANLYVEVGKYTDAIELFEKVLEESRRVRGDKDAETLRIRNDQAFLYAIMGKYSEAIQIMEELLKECKIFFGEDHQHTLAARHNIANSYAELGEHTYVIQVLEEILEKSMEILGEDHPETLRIRNSLGYSYRSIGNHFDAIQMQKEVSEKCKRLFGDGHPSTLVVKRDIARSYAEQGKHADAIQIFEEVLLKQTLILSTDHRDILKTRHYLANSHAELGNHTDAIQMYEEVLDKRTNILGTNHPDTLTTRSNLANLYVKVGNQSSAVEKLE